MHVYKILLLHFLCSDIVILCYNVDSLANQYFTNQIPQLHSFYQGILVYWCECLV